MDYLWNPPSTWSVNSLYVWLKLFKCLKNMQKGIFYEICLSKIYHNFILPLSSIKAVKESRNTWSNSSNKCCKVKGGSCICTKKIESLNSSTKRVVTKTEPLKEECFTSYLKASLPPLELYLKICTSREKSHSTMSLYFYFWKY